MLVVWSLGPALFSVFRFRGSGDSALSLSLPFVSMMRAQPHAPWGVILLCFSLSSI